MNVALIILANTLYRCSFAREAEIEDQEQMTDDAANGDICGATGLPCCRCNPGACESRK